MKCVTPMFRIYELGNHKNGKIVPRSEVLYEMNFDDNYIRNSMRTWRNLHTNKGIELVPCQHCWACQLNYSAEKATQVMLEASYYENNYFMTLTYDDEHLPIAQEQQMVETKTGDIINFCNDGTWEGTLVPEHMHTFLNSLRKYFERKGHTGIKYLYCGEYGETTHRPHYHIILLNCPLDPELFRDFHVDKQFKAHWKSKEIERFWDKGMIDIAEVEWSSVAYVARYCTKKLSNDIDKTIYYQQGKIPEYIRMSRNLGKRYYDEHKEEIYKTDEILMRTVKGNIGSKKPPKAFDKRFKEEHPKEWALIQKSRKYAQKRAEKLQNELNTYSDKNKMIMDAEKLRTKMSMLPREGEF